MTVGGQEYLEKHALRVPAPSFREKHPRLLLKEGAALGDVAAA